MRAVRSIKCFGGILGLFALCLQLVLSFGHVHADHHQPSSEHAFAVVGDNSSPVNSDDEGRAAPVPDDDDDCPICASMHLASTLVIPAPPNLIVPASFGSAAFKHEIALTLSLRRFTLSRTRAPPIERHPANA
jgi:hypothetical protein